MKSGNGLLVIVPALLRDALVIEGDCLNVVFLGQVEGWRVVPVADDNLDLAFGDVAFVDGVKNSFQIGAPTGDKNANGDRDYFPPLSGWSSVVPRKLSLTFSAIVFICSTGMSFTF